MHKLIPSVLDCWLENCTGNIMLTDAKTAACLYVACKQHNCYRSTREIAAIYAVNKNELTNAIRRLLNHVTLDVAKTASTEIIDRYCSHLELTRDQRKRAYKIASAIDERFVKKKIEPETVAGASIFLAISSERGRQQAFFYFTVQTICIHDLFLLICLSSLNHRLDYQPKICTRARIAAQKHRFRHGHPGKCN